MDRNELKQFIEQLDGIGNKLAEIRGIAEEKLEKQPLYHRAVGVDWTFWEFYDSCHALQSEDSKLALYINSDDQVVIADNNYDSEEFMISFDPIPVTDVVKGRLYAVDPSSEVEAGSVILVSEIGVHGLLGEIMVTDKGENFHAKCESGEVELYEIISKREFEQKNPILPKFEVGGLCCSDLPNMCHTCN